MAEKYPNHPLKVVDNVVNKPYTVQRLVERPVEKVVDKQVTLERVIERLVVDTVDKVVDKPATVSRLVERPVVTIERQDRRQAGERQPASWSARWSPCTTRSSTSRRGRPARRAARCDRARQRG